MNQPVIYLTFLFWLVSTTKAIWWSIGLQNQLFSPNRLSFELNNGNDLCSTLSDRLTLGQLKLCQLYTDHIQAIAKGARIGTVECQHQFRQQQWNCSQVSNETVYGGAVITMATRETAFVHAISAAGVLQAVARSCRNGDLKACGCSTTRRPANLNRDWVWGGCGDNVEYGYKFTKAFVDIAEKSLNEDRHRLMLNRRRKSDKSLIGSTSLESVNHVSSFEMRRAKARRLMNIHNNEAGRRAVYRLVKIECKCHGVSGSCSMKTCWLKLPSFREVGDYLKEKYDSAIEVRYESRQNQLRARHRRFSKPTKEDLIYIDDSPNYCAPQPKLGLLGTQGRVCNKNSNGPDGCRILCCGRGYFIQRSIREEKCKCKFQWCCSVKCETCITEVETYICK